MVFPAGKHVIGSPFSKNEALLFVLKRQDPFCPQVPQGAPHGPAAAYLSWRLLLWGILSLF
jgi:hypothetical protein